MILRTKNVWIAQEITTFITEKGRNHDEAAAEYPSDGPNREVDERAWGPIRHKELLELVAA